MWSEEKIFLCQTELWKPSVERGEMCIRDSNYSALWWQFKKSDQFRSSDGDFVPTHSVESAVKVESLHDAHVVVQTQFLKHNKRMMSNVYSVSADYRIDRRIYNTSIYSSVHSRSELKSG